MADERGGRLNTSVYAAGVGKSALAVLFCEDKFDGNHCVTVNNTWRKKCIINNRIVLQVLILEKF